MRVPIERDISVIILGLLFLFALVEHTSSLEVGYIRLSCHGGYWSCKGIVVKAHLVPLRTLARGKSCSLY